jgi:succinate dehydrogenase / fumarate reductase, cytochrome b subunit
MERALTLYRSTVGKKAMMAASGVVLFGFVVGHLLGNLQVFAGPQTLNDYAAWLRTQPGLLWGTRLMLLVAVGAHIASAFSLGKKNREARPVDYRRRKDVATNYAARTMYLTGPLLLLFLAYHLAHLTFGRGAPYEFDAANVYNNMVLGFQVWWISAIYVVGNLALGLHLFHGLWSMFGSVGVSHPKVDPWRRRFAVAFALLLTVGNLSIPVAVMAGAVQPTPMEFDYPYPER